jgi:LCP family protein required for cell wall assembly
MAREEKPYRVYRGGRVKGKVPTIPRPERERRDPRDRRDGRGTRGPAGAGGEAPPRWGRRIGLTLGLLIVLLVVWGVASFLAFRKGVDAANARLGETTRQTLSAPDGGILSQPTNTLLIGTDTANLEARQGLRHSDSMMLVRTDPDKNRISYLSIPRDLYVEIPEHGRQKANTAFQIGGAALTVRMVRQLTGLPVHHVALVQFEDFEELIDALGGVTIDVPKPIVSNRFDCPYPTNARCQEWPGWKFGKGEQTMDGRRALIYARVRENRLDPGENDLTRGERQQQVLRAISAELTSPVTLVKMPFVGGDLLAPLATDLSAWEFVQLGWIKFRADDATELHCRLGGSATFAGGQSILEPESEDIFRVVLMFAGRSAPQPPPPGSGPFGPGCVVGSSLR